MDTFIGICKDEGIAPTRRQVGIILRAETEEEALLAFKAMEKLNPSLGVHEDGIKQVYLNTEKEPKTQECSSLGQVVDQVTEILYKYDVVGASAKANKAGVEADEYDMEALNIVGNLWECETVNDVEKKIVEVFIESCGIMSAVSIQNYKLIAEEIWGIWNGNIAGGEE